MSTRSYDEFERLRNKQGNLFVYYTDVPDSFKADVKRKADKAISKGKNISSVYFPDVTLTLAFGDTKGTTDALLFVFDKDYATIEIFVARGQKNNRLNLWQMLTGGELDDELADLREKAVTDLVTDTTDKAGEKAVTDLVTDTNKICKISNRKKSE